MINDFVKKYQNKENQIISEIITTDSVTPVSVLINIARDQKYYGFFESVTGGENKGRYSIMALMPDLLWICKNNKVYEAQESRNFTPDLVEDNANNIFASLRNFHKKTHISAENFGTLPAATAGIFGFMSYDMVRFMEKIPDKNPANLDIPDAIYFRPKLVIVFDNIADKAFVAAPIYHSENIPAAEAYNKAHELIKKTIKSFFVSNPASKNLSKSENKINISASSNFEEYAKIVRKAKEYIKAGDIFQVVLSRRFSADFNHPPISFYRALRSINPSPYLFFLNFDNFVITGSSPEILVKLHEGVVTVRPIAGTRKRGKTKMEDKNLETELLNDPKEISEHLMLLDLGRNDVGRVAEKGTVKVTEQHLVERYSHVMHIVSNVEGNIAAGKDAVDCLISGFPAGTVSGAPKIRAMEIIEELEQQRRQFYAGTVGYFSANGDMDTCIALRTALIKDGKIHIQAGGGVVFDSTEEGEFQETENKAKALFKAVDEAENYLL